MSINFDKLPQERVNEVVAPGFYKFEIVKAEMKTPYNGVGDDYLGLNLALTTLDGKKAGFINDKIVENPKPSVAYKIGRLIRAADLDIEGEMELSDIAKIIVGAKGFVDISNFTTEDNKVIATINLFTNDCYYKKSERKVIQEILDKAQDTAPASISAIVEDDDLPFDTAQPTNTTEDDEY